MQAWLNASWSGSFHSYHNWYLLLSCMHQPIQPKKLKILSWWEEVGNSFILLTLPLTCRLRQASNLEIRVAENNFIQSRLPGFELETSGLDTILSCMHQPIQSKSLNKEVDNSLVLQHLSTCQPEYNGSYPICSYMFLQFICLFLTMFSNHQWL